MKRDVTFVITSCARFDLLKTTLDSFLELNFLLVDRYILMEDGGGRSVSNIVAQYPVRF